MGSIICYSISLFISCFTTVFIWSKLYDSNINFCKFSSYISLFLLFTVSTFNFFFVTAYLRMILNMFLFIICIYLIFQKSIKETIIGALYSEFVLTLCDVFCALFVMLIFNVRADSISGNIFMTSCGNILTSIVCVLCSFFPIFKVLYKKLIHFTIRVHNVSLIPLCIFIIISFNYLMAMIYFSLNPKLIAFINSIMIIIYSFIIYRSLNEKSISISVKAENDSLMNSLHQYEDMVDRQRVDNHENKNQLLIIKNMIKKNDKDVVMYIDTIVKDQKEDDETLYTRVMTIPSGGLQGIIYQKMLVMKDEHIKFSLDVGRGVKDFDLSKLSIDDNYRLCKIVGVFLDNAIEESLKIIDRHVMISLYVDDGKLVTEVSNKFRGRIEIDKMDESGYTTKGEGHGYGLSLVKKILSETNVFENERCIKRNIFKQVIRIKNT